MESKLWARAEEIFQSLTEIPKADRLKFIEQECGDNSALRSIVEKLMEIDARGVSGFLEPQSPPPQAVQSMVGQKVGNYELLQIIGRGSMGTVYLARQDKPRRDVAVKVLHTGMTENTLSTRFFQEIQILGQLNHPGIVKIFEAGTTKQGQAFFAMEFVPGQSLGEFAGQENLSIQEKMQMVIGICRAVQHAHDQGVIHRDLKPSNLMAHRADDGTIQIRVLDFGVARATGLDGDLATLNTINGLLLGTLAYMSQEQVAGSSDTIDARSDVYQIGVIFYELLAGKLPLDMKTSGFIEAIKIIAELEPPLLGKVDQIYCGDAENIVAKAMAKQRDDRFQTADELADDIQRHLDGEAIQARPAPPINQLRKVFKRRRAFILSLMMVTIATVMLTWFVVQDEVAPPTGAPKFTAITPEVELVNGPIYTSISPDGNRLAILNPDHSLKILSIDTKEEQLIWDGRDADITVTEKEQMTVGWLPSGQQIYLFRANPDSGFVLTHIDISTGADSIFYSSRNPEYPLLSPNGKLVLLQRNQLQELAVVDLSTGQSTVLASALKDEEINSPVWGPNSLRVAYFRYSGYYRNKLECSDLQGSSTVLLEEASMQAGNFHRSLCWLPNHKLIHIRIHNDSNSGSDLWALPMDPTHCAAKGESFLFHTSPRRQLMNLSCSRDGNRLSYLSVEMKKTTWLLEMGPDEKLAARKLPNRGWPTVPKSWAPDGKNILIGQTNGTNDTDILLQDVVSGEIKYLATEPGNSTLGLSGDGKHLLFTRESALYCLSLTDGKQAELGEQWLTERTILGMANPLNADGRTFLFTRREGGIIVSEVDAGSRSITTAHILSPDFNVVTSTSSVPIGMSSDATRLVYMTSGKEIAVYDLASGKAKTIPVEFGDMQGLAWSPDNQWVFCRGMNNSKATYWIGRVNVHTGASELIWTSETTWPSDMYPSPDGSKIACQLVELRVNICMLEGL